MLPPNPPQPRRRSLNDRLPELAAEWHPTLNGALTFDQFSTASTIPVWWQCLRIPSHIWKASVKSRYSKQSGCRRCRLAMGPHQGIAFRDRTLAVKSPDIADTWHPTKNAPITPDDITVRSRFRAWWQCPHHPAHVWDATVHDRHRSGCPYCAGHRVRKTSPRQKSQGPLTSTHPALILEWHGERNATLNPEHVTAGSRTMVWWQCPRNSQHLYQASIRSRARLTTPATCPHCAAIRRTMHAVTRGSGTRIPNR